jgi:hypothetical protein
VETAITPIRRRGQKVMKQISEHHPGSENHQNPTHNPTFYCTHHECTLILRMPPYTSEARKAQYLTYREMGLKNTQAAEKAGVHRITGHNIWARAGQLESDHSEQGLPPPTIEELAAVKPKTGRPKALNELECNAIFAACTASKKARKKRQHHIALEEGFEACRRTIETRMRAMNLQRCKPTKKLGLTDIQRAQRYEIALSRKDWGYAEWSKVVFSDEASILVGEH